MQLRRLWILLQLVISTTVLCRARPPPSKQQICTSDWKSSKFALDLVSVSQETSVYPKILCFINTISTHHHTRVQAIFDTWGTKCDKLVFCSNQTDERLGAVRIAGNSDHDHLWQKHKRSIQYIWQTYQHDFDWFYKADDDAFVIVENLKLYLRSPELMMKMQTEPVQIGHRFNLTEKLLQYYVVDPTLRAAFTAKFDRWVFNSGGPGYGMNRLYMQKFVESMDKWTCLSDKYSQMLPDDAAISFCMALTHGVLPYDTRDYHGRERFHADKPSGVYFTNPNQPEYWFVQYHNQIGGLQWKRDCCSSDSIAFHYITGNHMYHIARWLYFCRSGIQDLQEFNRVSGMRLPDTIFAGRADKS